ncbi:uncharacterized protein LOC142977174 [Anticarsia gemmatalis]|uniref:uncharacterized protein LOC142977174 n=1 Tax=Anticarsia gemmatalis TaxID=129554 RepID=UPI003F77768A
MKLPISLLVLAALGQAASPTTPRSLATTQTIKRELLEGNFGDRTGVLKKYVATESTPGIQYADDLKQELELQDQSPAHQIFGARLPQITKISDLLSGQGPPFEIALANHLYSPVSAYNSRLPPQNIFEVPSPAATKNIYSDPNIFKPQNQSPQEDSHKLQELPSNQAPVQQLGFQNADFFSYHKPNTVNYPSSSLNNGFSGQEPSFPKELYQQPKTFSGAPSPHLFPIFDDQTPFRFPGQNLPLQFYQQQSLVQYVPVDPGFDYTAKGGRGKEETREPLKAEPAERPKLQEQASIPKQAYHAHPNGAISYASFTQNQANFDRQPDPLKYEQPSKFQQQPSASNQVQLNQQQPIYVPELRPPQSEGRKLETVKEQQYVPVQPPKYPQGVLLQQVPEQSPRPHIVSIPQPKHQFFLNPVRQQLFYELEREPLLQPVQLQPSEGKPAAGPHPKSLEQSTTVSPIAYHRPKYQEAAESKPFRFPELPSSQSPVHVLPLGQYTATPSPVPYRQTVIPLHHPTLQPHINITPKPQSPPDQLLQATTAKPETVRSNPREPQPRSSYQDSRSLQTPQPTSQSLLASPVTLQSLTYEPSEYYASSTARPEILTRAEQSNIPTSARHLVQIQQSKELQEIHTELKPEAKFQPRQPGRSLKLEKHPGLTTTSGEYQSLSTPQPVEPTKADYEIEIATNVDHSQLPKDLQPVTTRPLIRSQGEPIEHREQTHNDQQQEQQSRNQEQSEPRQEQSQTEQEEQSPNTLDEQQIPQQENQVEEIGPHPETIQPHPGTVRFQAIHPSGLDFGAHAPFFSPVVPHYQPLLEPRVLHNPGDFVLQTEYQPTSEPTFPPQFFGKYAESIFGGFHR